MKTIHLNPIRRLPHLQRTCLALALLFGAASFHEAQAASRFWTGAINGNFSTPGNWVGTVAPAAGDDVVFQPNSVVTRLLATNNFSPNRAFNSVLFQGSNYFVRGNAILVTNGINSVNPVGPNTIDADVDIRGSQPWEATGSLGVLDINGDINLNTNTLTVRANTGDFFFSGLISGTGNLVKTNVGTLRMDGAGNNTYSGFTRFDGGVLELDKFGLVSIMPLIFTNFIAIPGDLTIGDGNGLVGTDVLRLLANDQIADASDVTVKNSGRFDLNGFDEHIASLTMQGGTVNSGSGILILGGNVTTFADANSAVINGNLSLGGASRIFNVNAGLASADLRINATISPGTTLIFATAGITKNGGGTLQLAGTNTYNGVTFVDDGQLVVLADRALGATTTILGGSAGTVVNRNANLFLSNVQVTNEDLTINSPNAGGAFNASGASVWTGDILLNTNAFIASSSSLLLSGAISGVGGFTKLSAGSITLAGTNANTYTGTTIVRDGTVFLDKTAVIDGAMAGPLVIGEDELPENTDVVRYLSSNQLPNVTDVIINASGLLDLNGFGDAVNNITLNGGDIQTAAAGVIVPGGDITVNANTNSQAIIGGRLSVSGSPIINTIGHNFSPDLRIDAQVLGAAGFTKNGVGEVSLTSPNIFTGTVIVNDGFLEVDDSLALGSTAGGTVVNAGAVLALRFNSHVPAEPLQLAGTGQSAFGALSSSFGSNSWAGNITLSADATVSVDAGDSLNISGAITGPFDFTKTSTGTLQFSGGVANNFGTMFVNQGLFEMNKTAFLNAATPLVIGDDVNAATARNLQDSQTDGVTVNSGSLWDLGGNNDAITPLVLDNGGDVVTGAGTLSFGAAGSVTVTGGSFGLFGSASTISGHLNLGSSGTRTFSVVERAPFLLFGDSTELVVNAIVSGTAGLNKTGPGDMSLTAANTFAGNVTVSDGELLISNDAALGTTAGTTTVNGDALLGISGDITVAGETLTLNTTGQGADGAVQNTGGTNAWTGPISLARTAVINVATNTALILSGAISGAGGVTKIGPGRLEFAGIGANTYAGVTTVNAGTLELRKLLVVDGAIPGDLIIGDGSGGALSDVVRVFGSAQIATISDVTMNSSGLLDLNEISEGIGTLAGSGRVDLGGAGTGALVLNGNGSTEYSGLIVGTGLPSAALRKRGTGTFTLSGDNTYAGTNLVEAGTLLVNGAQPNSDVLVLTGATLGGTGSVGDLKVNNIGNLAPGASPGRLSSRNTKLDPASNFRVEINGPIAGSGYDQLNVIGAVDLNGALLLATKSPGYAPADGDVITIVNNDGVDAVTGAFGGRAEGSVSTIGGISFRISYAGGSGNDVTLTATNIPLRFASARVEAGNGNGRIDSDECDHLFIALENRTGSAVTGVSARLDSLTSGVAVTQSESAYPNIPALGFGTNGTPFQLRVAPNFVCGQNVLLSLVVSSAGMGNFSVPITLNSGAPGAFTTFNSTNIPKAIPDLGTTNSVVMVTNSFPVAKVLVSLHSTHPAAGDLRFRLRSPNGTEVLLSANRGGNVANYGSSCAVRTSFDDDAATKIAAASAPFVGTFAPEGNLAAFIGQQSSGIWQLLVDDTVAGDTGTLQCWSLLLASATCASGGGGCESCLASVAGSLTDASPTLTERVFRTGAPSGCGNTKLCPGGSVSGSVPPFRYNTHRFTNDGPDTCVTVVLTVPCTGNTNEMESAAYLNSFNPLDLCENYLGDAGNSVAGGSAGYSFRVAAGARFVVLVHEVNPTDVAQGCPGYTVEIYGLPCPPPTLFVEKVPTPPNRVRLHWSTAYPDFQLQRSASLNGDPPFPFVNVPGVPFVIGGDYNVTNSATADDDYFRLRKP